MSQDYIVFGGGHNGSVFSVDAKLSEMVVLPLPLTSNRSEKVTPQDLLIFDVVQMEYQGKKYNVASDGVVPEDDLASVVEKRRPSPVN